MSMAKRKNFHLSAYHLALEDKLRRSKETYPTGSDEEQKNIACIALLGKVSGYHLRQYNACIAEEKGDTTEQKYQLKQAISAAV